MSKQIKPYEGDLAVLFPGEPVPLNAEETAHAVVYPVGLQKITEYASMLWGIAKQLGSDPATPKFRDELVAKLSEIAPQLLSHSWTLVREHTKPDPADFPPDLAMAVCRAFVKVNFTSEERSKNWLGAVALAAEAAPNWTSAIISQYVWPAVTVLRRWSVGNNKTDSAILCRILDGPFRSSGTGSTAPTDLPAPSAPTPSETSAQPSE